MWIQLLAYHRFPDVTGKRILRYPGDVVFVRNRAICQELIENGQAMDMSLTPENVPPGTGVLLWGSGEPTWTSAISCPVTEGDFGLPYPLTVVLRKDAVPQHDDLLVALAQFARRDWDVAAPLWDYAKTAANVGSPQDRERTAAVLPTIYSAVYDTRLILVKRNEWTEALFAAFAEEREGAQNLDVAFLRALYQSPVKMWALQKEILRA